MKKVLIVDDDQDLLEMVDMALTEQGFTVSALAEGKLFFDRVESFNPDIILLDIFLGDTDGRTLCHQLKSDPSLQHIPVALYSAGHTTNSSILESRANMFITKPFDIMQLGEKLRSMLATGRIGKLGEKYLDIVLHYVPLRVRNLKSVRLSREVNAKWAL
jgi:DNA-binding response OmpR family regulator